MVVIPPGQFIMGAPTSKGRNTTEEEPQHDVLFAKPFAVSEFEVTFDDWDACGTYGDCGPNISDSWLQRGRKPVINVSWDDAQRYVKWLSKVTGKSYRLLSEAEWEYAARAGTRTAYSWGDEIGENNAHCADCGSAWARQTAPVGSFSSNKFGLYDMHGNVWGWVEDCLHENYMGAPNDGSAWTARGDCGYRIVRGGSWDLKGVTLRSAARGWDAANARLSNIGIRVARSLTP
jgi:formylglycine-generating enzyme required for sulfatase activity